MRDILCNKDYLNEKIKFNEDQIDKKISKIASIQKDIENGIQKYPKENKDIIFSAKVRMFQLLFELIRAKYSLGVACVELETIYLQGIAIIKDIGYKNIGYVNLIQYFSIGILLEIPDESMYSLVEKADEEEIDDILFDFLVTACELKRKVSSSHFQKENPYKETQEIINMSLFNQEKASEFLKNYVDNNWLQGHLDFGWKEAYKKAGYVGLWSFESAAIAKIFKLEDRNLKNNNHYPYDLAHYKNDKIFHIKSLDFYKNNTSRENKKIGIPMNKELEQIIPMQFHELINQLILNYTSLNDYEFWEKYDLDNLWFTLNDYLEEKKRKQLLGTIIIEVLVNKGYVLQLDYKENIDFYAENIKNFWDEQDVKLVRFELDNDQNYYAKLPRKSSLQKIYEIKIVDEESRNIL